VSAAFDRGHAGRGQPAGDRVDRRDLGWQELGLQMCGLPILGLHDPDEPDLEVIMAALAEDPAICKWRIDIDQDGDALLTHVTMRFHDSADDEPSLRLCFISGGGERSVTFSFADGREPPGAVFQAQSTDSGSKAAPDIKDPDAHDIGGHGHAVDFRFKSETR
jgi:hypothetical protein